MQRTAAIVATAWAVAAAGGGTAAAADAPATASSAAAAAAAARGPEPVEIGAARVSAAAIGRADARPALLVPVRYPLHMKGRTARVEVDVRDGRRVVARAAATATLSAGLERTGVDRRRAFDFVQRVALPPRARALLAAGGRLDLRLGATAVLDADRDGRAEARSADAERQRVAAPSPGAAGLLCSTPQVAHVSPGRTVVVPLPQCTRPMRWRIAGRPSHGKAIRGRRWVAYRAVSGSRGWEGLTLRGRPAGGARAAGTPAATAASSPAVEAAVPLLVGSGAPSSVRVRAIGDSITAGFGWYWNGAAMSFEDLFGCRPGTVLYDACSSNSLTTSNTGPLRYAPDYGLSNRIAWPAQWAARYGVTDYANYAVTGSAPSDWLPGGAFYPQLRAAEASAPDYLVFTLGANPLLSNVLFGIGNMECAIWSDLFGNFTDCVLRAFAQVNLQTNLRALYAHLLANTPASTRIVAMQYYPAVPSIALAYTAKQLERMAELLDQVIAQTVAATGSPRIRTVAPPRFNVGLDMQPLYPSRYSCGSGFVDGPSNQSSATQWELYLDPVGGTFCSGTPWIISSDTGIHPNVNGHAQIASVLPPP